MIKSFPSPHIVSSYLEKHPQTKSFYAKNKGLSFYVGQYFGNTHKTPIDIKFGAIWTLFNANETFGIETNKVCDLIARTTYALQDWTEEEKIKSVREKRIFSAL